MQLTEQRRRRRFRVRIVARQRDLLSELADSAFFTSIAGFVFALIVAALIAWLIQPRDPSLVDPSEWIFAWTRDGGFAYIVLPFLFFFYWEYFTPRGSASRSFIGWSIGFTLGTGFGIAELTYLNFPFWLDSMLFGLWMAAFPGVALLAITLLVNALGFVVWPMIRRMNGSESG